jgi:hypothetical protein
VAADASTVQLPSYTAQLAMPSLSRVAGFLHLVRDVVLQFGIKFAPHLPRFMDVLVFILKAACSADGAEAEAEAAAAAAAAAAASPDNEEVEVEEEAIAAVGPNLQAKDLRSLAFTGLSAVFGEFPNYDYSEWGPAIMGCLTVPVTHLVSSMRFASKPSALLKLLGLMTRHRNLALLLDHLPAAVPAVVGCIGAGLEDLEDGSARAAAPAIITAVYEILENLLRLDTTLTDTVLSRRHVFGEGKTARAALEAVDAQEKGLPPLRLLLPHVPLLLQVHGSRGGAPWVAWVRSCGLLPELCVCVCDPRQRFARCTEDCVPCVQQPMALPCNPPCHAM